jgi:hypothetical protein
MDPAALRSIPRMVADVTATGLGARGSPVADVPSSLSQALNAQIAANEAINNDDFLISGMVAPPAGGSSGAKVGVPGLLRPIGSKPSGAQQILTDLLKSLSICRLLEPS